MTTRAACPTEQQIAAFVDGALATEERQSIQRHVEDCPACFDLVSTLAVQATQPLPLVDAGLRQAAVRKTAAPGIVRRLVPAMSAAAAVLVAAVWWSSLRHSTAIHSSIDVGPPASAQRDQTRSTADVGITVEEPRDGGEIHGAQVIRWRGVPNASSYEVQVTTAAGDVVLKRQVAGTVHDIRIEIPARGSETCYLWVAAYLSEGRRVTSNVIKVRIAQAN